MSESTALQVRAVFTSVLGVPHERLSDDASPDTIPSWDSLTHINLMLAIEGACGVQFEPDELMELRTVGAVVQRVIAARG
ncbi:acyl carrier protein [Gemmatimonas sp.]|jgi:acyl carrier protein|uniref:acyl carrier protein n=1 Tax=Gemmatimonas sp. TaxID=1962908 RepID=UPI0022C6BE1E|nr:acyl carrier protein [Gemmatimonas sp.]MCZ8204090.1 acyl carrier protein [Gemmatimonas sp.]